MITTNDMKYFAKLLPIYAFPLLAVVWLVVEVRSAFIKLKQQREQHEQLTEQCKADCDPARSLIIEDACHCRTDDGWKKMTEAP